jgi:hypothetical protein
MTVVVDTGVAVKWFVRETRRKQALKVLAAPGGTALGSLAVHIDAFTDG